MRFKASSYCSQVRFKVGFYLMSSLFTCLVICMASLGSLEVATTPNFASAAGGDVDAGIWGRTKAAFQRFKEVTLGQWFGRSLKSLP